MRFDKLEVELVQQGKPLCDAAYAAIRDLRADNEAKDAEIAGMIDKLNVLETEYQNLHPTINLANDRADAAEARVRLCHELLEQSQPFLDPDKHRDLSDRICNELMDECSCPDASEWDKSNARIAALERELAATHERARVLDRNLTIKSDELAEAKKDTARLDYLGSLTGEFEGPDGWTWYDNADELRAAIDEAGGE